MEALYESYRDEVEFFMVYIREAHPTDGWQLPVNEREEILFAQPTSAEERTDVAHAMCEKLEIDIPTIIDGIDNAVDKAYNAHPDRLYLVSGDGRIAYKGGPGPFGFKPKQLRDAIEELLRTTSATASDAD